MAGRIILFVGLMLMLAACQPEEGVVVGVTAVSPSPIPLPTATVPPPQIVTQVVAEKETAVSSPPNTPTPETELDFRYLNAVITQSLADFDGLYSVYVQELHSGETLEIDSNLAIAGMSLLKIPILVETYRALDQPPNIEQNKLISDTLGIQSGNYTANLLLQEVAGQPNTFIGADILTQSMKDIGLFNTFIAVPYLAEPRPGRLLTYLTPANQRTDRTTFPDPYRQTTTGDLGQLLTMIYECATEDNGQLRDVYADTITQTECQEMLAVLRRLKLEAFIEDGVPEGVPIAHKHGWIDDTHGDAGIVFSPAGDYVLVIALYTPEWLEWEIGNPLIAEISRLTYAHFNDPNPYPDPSIISNLQPPTPTSPATNLPHAIVNNTQGIGLTVRESPGGAEMAILPDGTILTLLDVEPIGLNGFEWHKVRLGNGREGWAAADYFEPIGD